MMLNCKTILCMGFVLVFSELSLEFRLLHLQSKTSWTTYYSADVNDCTEEGKSNRFPNLYSRYDHITTMGAPRNLAVTYFEREALALGGNVGYFYPGATITFLPPINASFSTGYEILISKNNADICLVLDFTTCTWSFEEIISLELFPLSGLRRFELFVRSLPRYSEHQDTEMKRIVTGGFGIRRQYPLLAPANWYAAVEYYVSHCNNQLSVEVVFSRPPPEYNFRKFEIALIPANADQKIQVESTTEYFHIFEDVQPGNYRIMLRPLDEYFSHTGQCLCHLEDGACWTCLSTNLNSVDIRYP